MTRLNTLFAAAFSLAAAASFAQTPTALPAGCATVEVHNVRPQQGNLMIAAFGDAESFSKKPLVSMNLPAGGAVMSFVLCGLSGEQVALTLFQDLDSDGKMGRNIVGLPTEPWGSSGTPGAFGPSWETARMPLDGKTLVVKMSL